MGLSFLFRPLGAVLSGHFGDRLGRRGVLMVTLFTMGTATALIGILPTYETASWFAPAALVLLRILQGTSAGGEWGSAVLLAVEHAPADKRGLYGAGPQVGVPAGLLLSSGVLALMTVIAPGEAFLQWGWRVPFLLSIGLTFLGWWIRTGVEESPVVEQMCEVGARNPVGSLFRRHAGLVCAAALIFLTVGLGLTYGEIGAFYAELFPASIRASGASISYALGAILGGAFAPTIAAALREATGGTTAITVYLMAATVTGFVVTLLMRERGGIPLGHEHEEAQAGGHFVWQKPAATL